jgi:hypothetical protein
MHVLPELLFHAAGGCVGRPGRCRHASSPAPSIILQGFYTCCLVVLSALQEHMLDELGSAHMSILHLHKSYEKHTCCLML